MHSLQDTINMQARQVKQRRLNYPYGSVVSPRIALYNVHSLHDE